MNKVLLSMTVLATAILGSHAGAAAINSVKAAELACHRIDRLAMLNKIDGTYVSKFQKMSLVVLPANDPSGAAFAVTAYQNAPSTTTASPLSVTLYFDSTGKALKHQVNAGGETGVDIHWSGKDPVSLTEEGLHYVIDAGETNEEIKPFANDFQALIIEQKLINGVAHGVLTIANKVNSSKLVITVDLNGKIISKDIVK